jgi:hypothetical protein
MRSNKRSTEPTNPSPTQRLLSPVATFAVAGSATSGGLVRFRGVGVRSAGVTSVEALRLSLTAAGLVTPPAAGPGITAGEECGVGRGVGCGLGSGVGAGGDGRAQPFLIRP